jgi:glucokinase
MSAAGNSHTALVGDIGGTNARLALADYVDGKPVISQIKDFPSAAYSKGGDVVRDYLSHAGLSAPPEIAVIAVAGPVTNGAVHLTNLGWSFSETELRDQGVPKVRFLNDFEALALATPHFMPSDLHILGLAHNYDTAFTVAVLGPGTGFGASALVRNDGETIALAAEPGHASFAPVDDVEREVLRLLARTYPHVSIERILSGPGLEKLHAVLNEIDGVTADAKSPTDITERALQGERYYERSLLQFCAILGSVAGNLALTYGARGGVYIAGGIAPSVLPILDRSAFRARFEAKGRFQAYLAPIPTSVVLHTHAAFLGAAEIAHHMGL